MKSKFIALFILAILLSACGQATTETADPPSGYSPEIDTQIAQALTSAVTPTKETLPTVTATFTPRATLTPTQTPLPTPTLPTPAKMYATPLPYLTNVAGYSDCDNSKYLKDITIKDGTVLMPGEPFKKIWRLKNTGTCAWHPEYTLIFVSGYDMEGETTMINQYVAPGDEGKISVSLIAPDVEGTYEGYWILTNRENEVFGQTIYVQIVVSEDETEEEDE
ncbi:MAG: hypothetical protein HUU38_11995 [Anaerolineales bacterium]|nr:hypothetical protein [Anaerolineales bacterium]